MHPTMFTGATECMIPSYAANRMTKYPTVLCFLLYWYIRKTGAQRGGGGVGGLFIRVTGGGGGSLPEELGGCSLWWGSGSDSV